MLSQPQCPALAVDAACSGNPGTLEFRAVLVDSPTGTNSANGTQIFHRGPYAEGTNNIGEFLAVVLGLAYLQKYHLSWPIYTDSVTAISWVRQRKCKSKVVWGKQNEELFHLVRKAEFWLHTHNWTTPVLKWETRLWGEIPADFGRKGG